MIRSLYQLMSKQEKKVQLRVKEIVLSLSSLKEEAKVTPMTLQNMIYRCQINTIATSMQM